MEAESLLEVQLMCIDVTLPESGRAWWRRLMRGSSWSLTRREYSRLSSVTVRRRSRISRPGLFSRPGEPGAGQAIPDS